MPRRITLPPHGRVEYGLPYSHSRPVGSCGLPWQEHRLPAEQVHPRINIAHRLIGNVAVSYREIIDHEFIAVLEGDGDFMLGSARYRYGNGCLLLIPPATPHTLITRCGSAGDHMAIHFDWAPGVPDIPSPSRTRGNYRVVIDDLPSLPPIMQLDDVAIGHIAEVVRQHRARAPLSSLRASIAMQRLVLHLVEGQRARAAVDDGDPAVAAALACIAGHYHEALLVDDLAVAAGLQRSRFAQRFKAWSGRPPMAFLRRYRIDRASELLQADPDRTLADIAQRCGFADAFSLSKAFRAELGLSPSAFRAGTA